MIILVKPLVTEKISALNEEGRYGFVVANKANKIQIKQAVEAMYGVTVEDVNTMRYQGKTKSRNTNSGMISGSTASYIKAIVNVAEG